MTTSQIATLHVALIEVTATYAGTKWVEALFLQGALALRPSLFLWGRGKDTLPLGKNPHSLNLNHTYNRFNGAKLPCSTYEEWLLFPPLTSEKPCQCRRKYQKANGRYNDSKMFLGHSPLANHCSFSSATMLLTPKRLY